MFKDVWDARLAQAADTSKTLKRDIHKIEKQIEALLDRVVESGVGSVIAAYEKRTGKLESEKALLEERVAMGGKPKNAPEESFELALRFLSTPWNILKMFGLSGKNDASSGLFGACSIQPQSGDSNPGFFLPFQGVGGIFSCRK